MEAQRPAEGILLQHDHGFSKTYLVSCTCGSPDDQLHVDVEAEESGVIVNIYSKQVSTYWKDRVVDEFGDSMKDGWFWGMVDTISYNMRYFLNSFNHRLKVTWRVWTKGYVEFESATYMTEQQALNFAETLKTAAEDVKSLRTQSLELRRAKNDKSKSS